MASYKQVFPSLSFKLGSAPFFIKYLKTISSTSSNIAQCNGVNPSISALLTSLLSFYKIYSNISRDSSVIEKWIGDSPEEFIYFKS